MLEGDHRRDRRHLRRSPQDFGAWSKRVFEATHSVNDELAWLEAEGPTSPALVRHLAAHQAAYEYVLFFSMRYYHAWHGARAVPDKAILIESVSRNTHDNLRQASRLMQQHDLHRVVIVSDPLHMARALRISRELGIQAVGSPTPTSRFRTFATRWRFLLQEVYFFHRDRLPR